MKPPPAQQDLGVSFLGSASLPAGRQVSCPEVSWREIKGCFQQILHHSSQTQQAFYTMKNNEKEGY